MKAIRRFILEFLLKNWGLKATSLLIALALWVMVRGSQGEHVITVPLTVQIPRNMEIVNQRPSFVEITAQGYMSNLAGGQPNLSYTIDLQSASEGEQVIALTPEEVHVSPASGLRVLRVNPARITIDLERVISKDVPVRVIPQGIPAAGFDLYKTTWQPTIVTISGPRSVINPVKEMGTEPVSISKQSRSFRARVNFVVKDDDIHISPAGPAEVDVELGPHREARSFRVPVTVIESDAFTVSPGYVSVSVLAPVSMKDPPTVDDIKASVIASNIDPALNRLTAVPQVEFAREFDPNVVIRRVDPEQVTLIRKGSRK